MRTDGQNASYLVVIIIAVDKLENSSVHVVYEFRESLSRDLTRHSNNLEEQSSN